MRFTQNQANSGRHECSEVANSGRHKCSEVAGWASLAPNMITFSTKPVRAAKSQTTYVYRPGPPGCPKPTPKTTVHPTQTRPPKWEPLVGEVCLVSRTYMRYSPCMTRKFTRVCAFVDLLERLTVKLAKMQACKLDAEHALGTPRTRVCADGRCKTCPPIIAKLDGGKPPLLSHRS